MVDLNHRSRLQVFVGVVVVVGALYLAREVLIPFALAALISFLLAPLAGRIERWLGRIAAVVITVAVACGAVGTVGWIVAGQVTELAEMLPQYRDNIASKIEALRGGVIERASDTVKQIGQDIEEQRRETERQKQEAEVAREGEQAEQPFQPRPVAGAPQVAPQVAPQPEGEPLKVQVTEPEPSPLELIAGAFAPLLGPLGTAGMVIVLVVFMLLSRADIRDRVIRLMGRSRIHVTTEAINDAGQRVSRYLLMQTLINGIHGVAVALGMFFFDVPSFLLWGLLSAVLRFIPYVGPWVAAALPILVSLAVFDGWTQPILVFSYFVVLELLSNNVLEPWLYGHSAGVSPLAIILTAIFWTWLWGPLGLLLATPLTVCLVVLAKHIPHLEFINVMLSDQPVLEPPARFYQRLLAYDFDEARKIAEQGLDHADSLVGAYDEMLLPAMALIERDVHLGHIDKQQLMAMDEALRDIVERTSESAVRRERNSRRQKKDEAKKDEARKEEAKKDEAKKEEAKKEEARRDETRREETRKDETRKDETRREEARRDQARKEETKKDQARRNGADAAPAGGQDGAADATPPPPTLPPELSVLALPVVDAADEIAAEMLVQAVQAAGARCETGSLGESLAERVDLVREHAADVVCISVFRSHSAAQARRLCRRLQRHYPDVPLLVGLWTATDPLENARGRLGCGEDVRVVSTLRQALDELARLAQTRGSGVAMAAAGAGQQDGG